MEIPSYIAKNIEELFNNAPDEVLDIIEEGEIKSATESLSLTYGIPKDKGISLSNVITFTLIGAIRPEDILRALKELVEVDEETASHIQEDLYKTLFRRASIAIGIPREEEEEIATLEFSGVTSTAELRAQILEKTKRDSGLKTSQAVLPQKGVEKKLVILKPGSRTQLLEQLQVLGTIPNDDEISVRLKHIQDQIRAMKKEEEDTSLQSKIALKSFMFGEKGKTVATPSVNKATYSVPPTHYNIDPYREVSADTFIILSTHGGTV